MFNLYGYSTYFSLYTCQSYRRKLVFLCALLASLGKTAAQRKPAIQCKTLHKVWHKWKFHLNLFRNTTLFVCCFFVLFFKRSINQLFLLMDNLDLCWMSHTYRMGPVLWYSRRMVMWHLGHPTTPRWGV